MGVRAHRAVLLTPGVVLGAVPLNGGMVVGRYRLARLGAAALAAAAGDLCFLWALRRVPVAPASARTRPTHGSCW